MDKADFAGSKMEGRDDNSPDDGRRYQGAMEKNREQKSAQVICNMDGSK